jgi:methyl-accepting chemotaxis protein
LNLEGRYLVEGARTQVPAPEETSASVEELAASVDQVSEHAKSQVHAVKRGAASMLRVRKSIEEVSSNLAAVSELARASALSGRP